MKKPIVVLGIGELGSVFSRAFLKTTMLFIQSLDQQILMH
jgi:hypothetical protein